MKIHQYFSVLAVLMAVLFAAAALTPTTSFAAARDSKKSNVKPCPANCVSKTAVKYTKASNGTFKRQIARAQSNTLQKPSCVQCWTDTGSNWGNAATSGSGTSQQYNPRIVCSTCVPAWSLPATAARAPAKTTSNQTSNSVVTCSTCLPCGNVPLSSWSTPATAGTTVTNTPPAEPTPAATTTTTTTQSYRCEGLLCSILQVPYNIGAFVFGGCPMTGCS
jgi:hypothetical protein